MKEFIFDTSQYDSVEQSVSETKVQSIETEHVKDLVSKENAVNIDKSVDLKPGNQVIELCTPQQRAALFGPISNAIARAHRSTPAEAQEWLKSALIKRGMIKSSRTELTKQDARKVIDGMCKMLKIEINSVQ